MVCVELCGPGGPWGDRGVRCLGGLERACSCTLSRSSMGRCVSLNGPTG